MQSLRPTSILLGVLADKAIFVALALTLAALVGVSAPAFQMLALAAGLGATILGGFVGAWHARSRYLPHGLAVGAMGVAISFGRFIVNGIWPPAQAAAQHPLWWELLGWTGALFAGLLGGWLAHTAARRSFVQRNPRTGKARWGLWLPVIFAVIALLAFAEQL
jgi:hypothetical protein